MTREVVLVPRRDDNGWRDDLWTFVRAWWEREYSHAPIIEGYHVDGLFCRSAAVNRAAELAGDWDVAVLIDADVVVDPNRVREGVRLALATGSIVLPHTIRKDLSPKATRYAMQGHRPFDIRTAEHDYVNRRDVHHEYSEDNGHPSVSSVVIVPRSAWDAIGGFDESFRGWGFEDTAFAAAAATLAGIERMPGIVWHFWHPTSREGKRGSRSWEVNSAKGQRYRAAIGDAGAIRALQAESRFADTSPSTIPRILHRVVPERTDERVERWWMRFEDLHPGWSLLTHRDPLDPAEWPLTSPYWPRVENGAQLADLVRLEALLRWGGVYVDSDVEPFRALDPLLELRAFAAWEDHRTIPNAVLGAVPAHPAIRACLDECIAAIEEHRGTWHGGPGAVTAVLPGRSDALILPPDAFYPVHYLDEDRDAKMNDFDIAEHPWTFALHWYAGSWLPKDGAA